MAAVVLAYLGLLAWSFLAATVLPLSSELALVGLVRTQHALVTPVLIATIGNYGGACTTYWLGRRVGQALDQRAPPTQRQRQALSLFRRFGQPVLLLSWLPILGDALVAIAGTTRIPFGTFSLYVLLGKAARYLAVAWAAYALLG